MNCAREALLVFRRISCTAWIEELAGRLALLVFGFDRGSLSFRWRKRSLGLQGVIDFDFFIKLWCHRRFETLFDFFRLLRSGLFCFRSCHIKRVLGDLDFDLVLLVHCLLEIWVHLPLENRKTFFRLWLDWKKLLLFSFRIPFFWFGSIRSVILFIQLLYFSSILVLDLNRSLNSPWRCFGRHFDFDLSFSVVITLEEVGVHLALE